MFFNVFYFYLNVFCINDTKWSENDMNLADDFYSRDAMLARIQGMAPCLSLCLCLSVTSRCSIKRYERINLGFGVEASFDQSYTVF